MANIKVELIEPLINGMDIKFKAPCDCTAISGLTVQYPKDDGSGTSSRTFMFKDAHGNTLTGLGNLFSAGVLVKVIVDTDTGAAYIQNADTNKYLEDKIPSVSTISGTITDTTGTGATMQYVIKKYGRVATLHCTFAYGKTDALAKFRISPSQLSLVEGEYNYAPFPITSYLTQATGQQLLGYGDVMTTSANLEVQAYTGLFKSINGYSCMTFITSA